MSTHNDVVHPKVAAGPSRDPEVETRPSAPPAQRDLVLASLLRCPDHRTSATGSKGA
jgi:hypothetical protein